jgi:two-component system chemotaxis response regulator CheY
MASPIETPFTDTRILVLEDNHGMREIIWSVLTAFGCSNVRCCARVVEALERTFTSPPDLAIVDYQLNDETGLEFVQSIRSSRDDAVAGVPVIMVTAHTYVTRIHEFVNAGVDEILAKPMQAETLYRRIAAVVNHRRPYVRLDGYFGPDRRIDAAPVATERRNGEDGGAAIVHI